MSPEERDKAREKVVAAFKSVGMPESAARIIAEQMFTSPLTGEELKPLISNESVSIHNQAKRNGSARVQFIDTARKAVSYVDQGGTPSEAIRRIRQGLEALDRHARRGAQPQKVET